MQSPWPEAVNQTLDSMAMTRAGGRWPLISWALSKTLTSFFTIRSKRLFKKKIEGKDWRMSKIINMNNLALHDIFIALLKQRFYCVFGENIIGAALKTTKELIFTKGMIVDRLADSFVHFDHYRTLMVKYECFIFQLHKAQA